MKILYVHGWKGSPNGNSFKKLKNLFQEYYPAAEVTAFAWDTEHPIVASCALNAVCADYNLIIASSAGAFLTLASTPEVPKILINPCMNPIEELPKLGASKETVSEYGSLFGFINRDDSMITVGCFAKDDELFGDVYEQPFNEITGGTTFPIEGGHHVSDEGARFIVATVVPYLMRKVTKIMKFLSGIDNLPMYD